jgi:hypothetical protein
MVIVVDVVSSVGIVRWLRIHGKLLYKTKEEGKLQRKDEMAHERERYRKWLIRDESFTLAGDANIVNRKQISPREFLKARRQVDTEEVNNGFRYEHSSQTQHNRRSQHH